MAIKCCSGCLPPKRTPGCHATCREYIDEKAIHEEKKAANDAKKKINQSIYGQRSAAVNRIMKRHGKKMGEGKI